MSIFNLIGTALSAGSETLQGHLNRKQSIENQRRTIQANKEQAKYAYSKELEMWNLANQYNTPSAQMKRFQEAGLNPHLIYGKGSAGTAAQSMPKYNAPRIDYNEKPFQLPQNVLSAFQDFRMKNAQIDNIRAQTNTQNEQTALAMMRKHIAGTSLLGKNYRMRFKNDPKDIFSISGNKTWLYQQQQSQLGRTQQQMRAIEFQNQYRQLENEWYMFNKLAKPIQGFFNFLKK